MRQSAPAAFHSLSQRFRNVLFANLIFRVLLGKQIARHALCRCIVSRLNSLLFRAPHAHPGLKIIIYGGRDPDGKNRFYFRPDAVKLQKRVGMCAFSENYCFPTPIKKKKKNAMYRANKFTTILCTPVLYSGRQGRNWEEGPRVRTSPEFILNVEHIFNCKRESSRYFRLEKCLHSPNIFFQLRSRLRPRRERNCLRHHILNVARPVFPHHSFISATRRRAYSVSVVAANCPIKGGG